MQNIEPALDALDRYMPWKARICSIIEKEISIQRNVHLECLAAVQMKTLKCHLHIS